METGASKPSLSTISSDRRIFILPTPFDEHSAQQCVLQLSIGRSRVVFSILNKTTASLVGLGEITIDIKTAGSSWLTQLTQKHTFFRYEFSQVIVLWDTEFQSMVPAPFFEESNTSEYLSFSQNIPSDYGVSFDVIRAQEAVLVYGFAKVEKELIANFFGKAFFIHERTGLTEALGLINRSSDGIGVYIGLTEETLQVSIFQQQKLVLMNHYYVEEPLDVLYYTLYALEQLEIGIDKASFWGYGKNISNEHLQHYFDTYAGGLKPLPYPKFVSLGKGLSETKVMENFASLNGFLCV